MGGALIEREVHTATVVARVHGKAVYGYYLPQRPPAPGACPPDALSTVALAYRTWHEDICQEVWGWVCYARPLTDAEVDEYELLPDEDNPWRYQEYSLVRRVNIADADGLSIPKRERVRTPEGEEFVTSYPGQAFAYLDRLNKQCGKASTIKVVKLPRTTDAAPTRQ